MFTKLQNRKAQSITEYAVLMGVVVLAILFVQIYLKRSIQGKFKGTADDIGEQFTTGQTYSLQHIQQSVRRETTGVGTVAQLADTWSQSTITAAGITGAPTALGFAGAQPILPTIAGNEITKSDYVTATVGAGVLGRHNTSKSGILQNKNVRNEGLGTGVD